VAGGAPLAAPGTRSSWFAALEADGSFRWGPLLAGGADTCEIEAISVGNADVAIAGLLQGEVDLGSGAPLVGSPNSIDGWVARVDRDTGVLVDARTIGGSAGQKTLAATLQPTGLFAAGTFVDEILLDDPVVASVPGADGWVAGFGDGPGLPVAWRLFLAGAADQTPHGIHARGQATIYVAGRFTGAMSVGGEMQVPLGVADAYVLALVP
jgi:hypothetical protein